MGSSLGTSMMAVVGKKSGRTASIMEGRGITTGMGSSNTTQHMRITRRSRDDGMI